MVDNPATLPDPQQRESIEEPDVCMEIYAPNDYNSALMGLCQDRRGEYIDMKYITTGRVTLIPSLRACMGIRLITWARAWLRSSKN